MQQQDGCPMATVADAKINIAEIDSLQREPVKHS
jgi:hypothetical protein